MGDIKDDAQAKLKAFDFQHGKYQHAKGSFYWVFATSVDEGTLELLVHYESIARGTRWTRTIQNFMEVITMPSGEKKSRFTFIGDE